MSEFSVLIDADGTVFYQKENDATLLQAALRAGVGFPYECSSGGCGSCRFKLLSGQVEEMWDDAPGLSGKDRAKGYYLACQTRANSDLVIRVSTAESYILPNVPKTEDMVLTERRVLTADMSEFTFKSNCAASFVPGQYAIIRASDGSRRCYSMSNLPNAEGIWQFIVKRYIGGHFSNILFNAPIGSVMKLDGAYGLAHVRSTERDVVCVAGGSGLGPIVSIVRSVASSAEYRDRRIFIFFGGRSAEDICGHEYFEPLAGYGDKIVFIPVVSELDHAARSGWKGATGFVHTEMLNRLGEYLKGCEVYFAGPPKMADAMLKSLVIDMKVPVSQVHFDRFV